MLLVTLQLSFAGCRTSENEYVPPPPAKVTVARPVEQIVQPFLEQNGETESVDEVEVRARVTGFIEEIRFEPGQEVAKDDVLYVIESDQYKAAVSSAQAAVAAAEAAIGVAEALVKTADAAVREAELRLARERELMSKGAGSQAELDAAIAADEAAKANADSARANVKAAEAEKGRAEASLEKANLDLNYTTVRAPISGAISKTDVKTGNLVQNGTELATIVDDQKIFANFSMSDRQLLRFLDSERKVIEAGEELEKVDWRKTPVYLKRETDQGFPFEGKLEYVDPQGIELKTGTLGLRAEFDNQAQQLLSGMFVTVRVPSQEPEPMLLIPEYASARDQRGLYVLTVDGDNEVQRTDITVSKSISGWAIVTSGLTAESRVVVEGIQRARPGLAVAPTEEELTVDSQTLLRGLSPTGQAPTEKASDSSDTSEE
jgi:RND family efflux transporter MFP subunit